MVAIIHHLSASALSDWLTCQMRWYVHRFENLSEPPTFAMAQGTAIDRALSAYHLPDDPRHPGRPSSPELALVKAWKEEVTMPAPKDALGNALNLLEVYTDSIKPEPDDWPQFRLSVPIPGLPVPFLGFVDLGRADGTLFDWKTTRGSYWTQEEADKSLQATAYWWAFWSFNHADQPADFVFQVLHTLDLTLTSFHTRRSERQLRDFEALLRTTYWFMREGLTQPDKLLTTCPSGWCPCPERCGRESPKLLTFRT